MPERDAPRAPGGEPAGVRSTDVSARSRPPRTLALTLAYDGTPYAGWQRQREGASIQQLVEEALASIEEAPVTAHASGRTDAGVHAIGQVVSCTLRHPIGCDALRRALNARLPVSIRVIDVTERPARFHARFSATSKSYAYRIWNARVEDPFEAGRSWHVPVALDVEAMRQALPALVGTHDFGAFQGPRSTVRDTVRTLTDARLDDLEVRRDVRAAVHVAPGRLLVLHLSGTGFLRHMVRAIAGTLVEVGSGRRPAGEMARVLASRDRRRAGRTAPPYGLVLVRVEYAGGAVPSLDVGGGGR
jgi:tRNA pseudouridine38-40 synthase